jgi:formylmethanofuran dehydrogenase subunit A
LRLPHPVHIHCNNLGMPGNWSTTLDTMRSVDGHRAHITHIQFHRYGGGEGQEASFTSQVAPLAEYVNSHRNITVDVGQVMFGETVTMTVDSGVGHFLHKLTKDKWYSSDTQLEAGCGVTPIRYRNKSLVNALQWAIGLEWYLLVDDPWRVAMSTDHPNGGSFLAYPEIIRLLMDRTYRGDVLKRCPAELRKRSLLAELDREYTLGEIAIITRAGPARILGLTHKGHLGPGADADITIYSPHDNPQTMFELPRMVIIAGEVIVENGEIRSTPNGKTLHVAPDYDRDMEAEFKSWIDENYSVRFGNYVIGGEEIANSEIVG